MNAASDGFAGERAELVDVERLKSVLDSVGPQSLARLLRECRRRLDLTTVALQHTSSTAEGRNPMRASLHKLRGSCGSLGLEALSAHLRRLETDIRSIDGAQLFTVCRSAAADVDGLIEATWTRLGAEAACELHDCGHETGDLNK